VWRLTQDVGSLGTVLTRRATEMAGIESGGDVSHIRPHVDPECGSSAANGTLFNKRLCYKHSVGGNFMDARHPAAEVTMLGN
jgi:hypothetical protein